MDGVDEEKDVFFGEKDTSPDFEMDFTNLFLSVNSSKDANATSFSNATLGDYLVDQLEIGREEGVLEEEEPEELEELGEMEGIWEESDQVAESDNVFPKEEEVEVEMEEKGISRRRRSHTSSRLFLLLYTQIK